MKVPCAEAQNHHAPFLAFWLRLCLIVYLHAVVANRYVTRSDVLRRPRQSVNQNYIVWLRMRTRCKKPSSEADNYVTRYAVSGWRERRKPSRAFQPQENHVDNSSLWHLHHKFSLHSWNKDKNFIVWKRSEALKDKTEQFTSCVNGPAPSEIPFTKTWY